MLQFNMHMMVLTDTVRPAPIAICAKPQQTLQTLFSVAPQSIYSISDTAAGSLLSPGSCIFWHICRSPSRPGWCWIRFCTSAEWKSASIRPPSEAEFKLAHVVLCCVVFCLDSPATPRPGERSSPARWEEPSPGSAGSTTAPSSYTLGSPWHKAACLSGSPGRKILGEKNALKRL